MLILDEPTASLSAHEVERLFTIVRGLRDRGVAILFVSHRLDEVFDLCDTRDRVPRRAPRHHDRRRASSRPPTSIRHMVGRTVSLFPKVETAVGDVLLEVEGLTRAGEFRGHRVLGPRRRDRRVGGPRRRRPDRGRPGAVRDRPARRRRGPRRRASRSSFASPSAGDGRRRRLPARGPPPGRPRARLLDRRERHAADPAAPVPAVLVRVSRSSGRVAATSTRTSSTSG